MNSEELEQSLKGEFESYIKELLAQTRGDVAEFQARIEAEMEKHRAQLDAAFQGFSSRFETAPEFEGGFKESVIEHLRLARDEGAKITATAIAEAEELEKAKEPSANLADLKEAINDISSKDSQSAILKTLITHAAKFTPRGAFFIVKNGHFVGWKLFGNEAGDGDNVVRDIHFSVDANSILGAAAKKLTTVDGAFGTFAEDSAFLDPLHFGKPDRMYAIPLVARGRGVAVLYADYGHEGVAVNTDALEMLVKVAGLTVELLASAKTTPSDGATAESNDFSDAQMDEDQTVSNSEPSFQPASASLPTTSVFASPFPVPPIAAVEANTPFANPVAETTTGDFDFKGGFDAGSEYVPAEPEKTESEFSAPITEFEAMPVTAFEATPSTDFESAPSTFEPPIPAPPVNFEPDSPFAAPAPPAETIAPPPLNDGDLSAELRAFEPAAPVAPEVEEVQISEPAMVFDAPAAPAESNNFENSPFNRPVEQFEQAGVPAAASPVAAPVVEKIISKPAVSRLSDRHVDLPIEVAEDERRLHNDARRFARLLVSEIKLYNEKKVQEGRENNDLYERLREAIDRSREMYDKRVQTPVSTKFDYFHYELVNALAEGDEARLGSKYPGPAV